MNCQVDEGRGRGGGGVTADMRNWPGSRGRPRVVKRGVRGRKSKGVRVKEVEGSRGGRSRVE